ncbi:MAG: hypothetical protein CVU36_10730 [Betaproteobacteria bacterium HGW-Betaproteobacteria-9]|nr:MAG: hypothetical protein CVU36_10730 [Betaproteobacteria bacterium HGW-Betaproteobacteria-9]
MAVMIRGADIFDFLVIYKALIYFLILLIFVDKKIFNKESITKIFWLVATMMAIKYSYTFGLAISDRPALYRENNFELMFLALVFYLKFVIHNSTTWKEQLIILLIFALSGSRSGILILFVVLFGIHFDKISARRILVGLIVVAASGFLAYLIVMSRMSDQGIEGIDRLNFLSKFLDETNSWGFIDWMIGSNRITPLSEATCTALSYYSELFSYSGDSSCYSVVFHSFILRAIFDHGAIGVLFMVWFIYWILQTSIFSRKDALIVIAIALLNGFSVSSINSYFFTMALMLYISFDNRNLERIDKNCVF